MQSVSVLLKNAIEVTKAKAKILYSITAIMYLAYIVVWVVGIAGVFGGAALAGSKGITVAAVLGITGFIVFFVMAIWIQVALYSAVINEIGFKQAFAMAKNKIWQYLLTSLLTGLITGLGFILLIVPGIIFAVWYAFGAVIVVAEGLSGMAALRQSKSYVKGRWGAVAWRLAAAALIVIIIQIAINLILPKTIASILSFVWAFLILPFFSVYIFLLYKNLKESMNILALTPPAEPVNQNEVHA